MGGVRPDIRFEERSPIEPVERPGIAPDERGVEHAEHPATEPLGPQDPADAGEVGDAGINRRARARERRDMTAVTHQPGELADRLFIRVEVSVAVLPVLPVEDLAGDADGVDGPREADVRDALQDRLDDLLTGQSHVQGRGDMDPQLRGRVALGHQAAQRHQLPLAGVQARARLHVAERELHDPAAQVRRNPVQRVDHFPSPAPVDRG